MSQLTAVYHGFVDSAVPPDYREWFHKNSWVAWVLVAASALVVYKLVF